MSRILRLVRRLLPLTAIHRTRRLAVAVAEPGVRDERRRREDERRRFWLDLRDGQRLAEQRRRARLEAELD